MRVILIFVLFLSSYSFGDSPALPISYIVESENGKYVFAMISPLKREVELGSLNDDWRGKVSKVRNTYPASGMYRNNEEKDLLWSVSWYAHEVEIANDGEYVVRAGPWASSFDDEAITFLRSGRVLKSYQVKDLVKKKRKVERTVSHFFWRNERLFDRKQLKYYLSTADSKHYVFDVASGEKIKSGQ